MDKVAVDATVAAMESSIHNIDLLALICGVFVAVFLAGEIWFIGAHWLKELTLKPLRERQTQLSELEMQRLKSETAIANKATEELKRQNLELEQAIAPRILNQAGPDRVLNAFPGQIVQLDTIMEFEAQRLAGGLSSLFKSVGWDLRPPDPRFSHAFEGVRIEYFQRAGPADPDPNQAQRVAAAKALAEELKKQNLKRPWPLYPAIPAPKKRYGRQE